jgi:hypothetical protein
VVVAAVVMLAAPFAPAGAQDEELTFIASVDRTRLGLDDHLVLTVSVSGSDIGGIPEPILPDLEDFQLVGTNRSSSSQYTLVNGKMTSSKTIDHLYTLRPEKTGRLTIGSARLDFRGKSYHSDPIEIEVVKGSAAPRSTPQTGTTPPPAPAAPEELSSDDLFVRVELDRKTAYVGEQITATYALYNRTDLVNVQYGQVPSFTGFWSEEVFNAERLNFQQQVIGGKRYQTAVLKKMALFPTTSGEIEVEPLQLICDLRQRGRDLFDFFGRTRRVRITTRPVAVTVKALPAQGRPADFSGAVGQYTLTARTDRTQLAAGEPLELTVEVRGKGNLKTLPPPRLPALDGFKSFDPEISESMSRSGGRIEGRKTYRYVLIPKEEGSYSIDPLSLTYFDPAKAVYQRAASEPIAITVLPGQEETYAPGAGLSKEEILVLGRDIRYIKPAPRDLQDRGDPLYSGILFQLVQALPLLAVAGAILARRRRDRLSADVPYARRRRAAKAAGKHLKEAENLIGGTSPAPFCGALHRGLCHYLADKLNLTAAGLTSQDVRRELSRRDIGEDLIGRVIEAMSACDVARFAPGGEQPEDRRGMLSGARELITRLERAGL